MSRFVRGIAALVVVGLALTACASKSTPQASGTSANPCSSPSVLTSGALTVGAEFPYYAPFLVGPQSSPTGYEGDMINEIAKRLNLAAVKWVNIAFDQLCAPGTKKFDVGVSEITITSERAKAVDFSEPYFDANQGILVRADSKYANATKTEDLLGAKFGAEAGTTGLDYVNAHVKPQKPVSQFDTTDVTAQALKTGTIDVQIIDVPIAAGIRDGSNVPLKIIGEFVTNEQYGLAMQKGSPIKSCVDQAIKDLKADGTLTKLQNKYFPGTNPLPVFQPTA
ncbi:MAG: amino acid ABC transporter substrate-binding protein [Actinobacteria bacterium]|nr:MAG: amino acid ABC transporter substrate-binding protein [Actinomycetota bacterium]